MTRDCTVPWHARVDDILPDLAELAKMVVAGADDPGDLLAHREMDVKGGIQ